MSKLAAWGTWPSKKDHLERADIAYSKEGVCARQQGQEPQQEIGELAQLRSPESGL